MGEDGTPRTITPAYSAPGGCPILAAPYQSPPPSSPSLRREAVAATPMQSGTTTVARKMRHLCDGVGAATVLWWGVEDGDKLTVQAQYVNPRTGTASEPQAAAAKPDKFAAESAKVKFELGDTSAVSRVYRSKNNIWMSSAQNDASYLRKDLAAQFDISSIGLCVLEEGVLEYCFDTPRSAEPELRFALTSTKRGRPSKYAGLSEEEKKKRRAEDHRESAKRSYYRRVAETQTLEQKIRTLRQENTDLRQQLHAALYKVAAYEANTLATPVMAAHAEAVSSFGSGGAPAPEPSWVHHTAAHGSTTQLPAKMAALFCPPPMGVADPPSWGAAPSPAPSPSPSPPMMQRCVAVPVGGAELPLHMLELQNRGAAPAPLPPTQVHTQDQLAPAHAQQAMAVGAIGGHRWTEQGALEEQRQKERSQLLRVFAELDDENDSGLENYQRGSDVSVDDTLELLFSD
jgi:hypothetical protein